MRKNIILGGVVIVLLGLLSILPSEKKSADQNGLSDGVVSANGNIKVYQPVAGDTVGQPLVIVGEARVFENNFNYRLVDKEGHQLAGSFGTAIASNVGEFGAFSVVLEYSYPGFSEGFVEVFTHSAKDGAEIDLVKIPVLFEERQDTNVKVYFGNSRSKQRDSGSGIVAQECGAVFPVFRNSPKTTAAVQAALAELIKGLTAAEQKVGYSTEINPGVRIHGLTVKNGLATVDLSAELMREVGDSCRVTIIKSQIEATLKQFKEVSQVNILVDGADDKVQP